jgi:hypothetical protein
MKKTCIDCGNLLPDEPTPKPDEPLWCHHCANVAVLQRVKRILGQRHETRSTRRSEK